MSENDLGIKIGTKRESYLTQWLETKEKELAAAEIEAKLSKYAIEVLKEEIAKEQEL